eukprot:312953_1
MPLWNLPKGLDVELYNNMVDGFNYFQTQIALTKKDYTSSHPSTQIHIIDSRDTEAEGDMDTNNTITPPVSNIKSILDKVDNQDECETIEELKQLPSLFRVNTSNLRKINVINCNDEDRDSDTSVLSVLSEANDNTNDNEDMKYPITPALKNDYSIFSPYITNKFVYQKQKNPYAFVTQRIETIHETPPNSTNSDSFGDINNIAWDELLSTLTGVDQDMILSEHGYKKMRFICKTLQGELIEAIKIEGKDIGQHVIIKITNKKLYKEHISIADNDGLNYCIEDDIFKEALILNHLTNHNKCSGQYITKYVQFFESEKDYYLVTECINKCMNLKTFIKKSFKYIKNQQLELKDYQHFVRYLMWQLCAVMQWMHEDMHCCHLKLCLNNILLQNAQFIQKKDGKVKINPSIAIKLTDFGKSEIFKCDITQLNPFKCQKPHLLFNDIQYLAPNIFDGNIYNAKKADIWSIGMIIYECYCGVPLYKKRICDKIKRIGSGFWSLENKKLSSYLSINGLNKYINNPKILSLLNGLLEINDKKRFNTLQILKHPYFKCYYKHYKHKIIKKSMQQKKDLLQQKEKMETFPYYSF